MEKAKIDCVVCGHTHVEGEPCDLCHCAAAVLEHPQGKPPIAERFRDVDLADQDEDEEGEQDVGGRGASRR